MCCTKRDSRKKNSKLLGQARLVTFFVQINFVFISIIHCLIITFCILAFVGDSYLLNWWWPWPALQRWNLFLNLPRVRTCCHQRCRLGGILLLADEHVLATVWSVHMDNSVMILMILLWHILAYGKIFISHSQAMWWNGILSVIVLVFGLWISSVHSFVPSC